MKGENQSLVDSISEGEVGVRGDYTLKVNVPAIKLFLK